LPSLPGLASKLRRFGLLVRLERPADRPSLAWPPVADVLSATLKGPVLQPAGPFAMQLRSKTRQAVDRPGLPETAVPAWG